MLLVCCLFVSPVYGAVWVAAEYPIGARDTTYTTYEMSVVHPSATSAVSAYFFTFMVNFDGGTLTCVNVDLSKEGSPVGYVCAELYATSGTYGSTMVPSGAALERSLIAYDVAMASLQNPGAFVMFNFSDTTVLSAGVAYAISIEEVNETTSDTSNGCRMEFDAVGSWGGNCGSYASGGWSASSSQDDDMCFQVYVNGGDAVTYLGNDIIYGDTSVSVTSSGVINASGAINATGDITAGGAITAGAVSAGAVSAGDITASGGVTVDTVTASFSNTNVTAESGTATIAQVDVQAEIANGTVLTAAGGGFGSDYTVIWIVMLVMTFVGLALRVPIIGVVVGGIALVVGAVSLGWELPAYPYLSILLAFMGVLNFLAIAIRLRDM